MQLLWKTHSLDLSAPAPQLLAVNHPSPFTLTPPHLSVPNADVTSSSGQTWPSLVASAMLSGQLCFGPYLSRATTTAGASSCALRASATLKRVPSSSGHAMTCCLAFLATLPSFRSLKDWTKRPGALHSLHLCACALGKMLRHSRVRERRRPQRCTSIVPAATLQ